MTNKESLQNMLKIRTARVHRAAEASLFFARLREGCLPLVSFSTYLRCLAIIHASLERNLHDSLDPRIKTLTALDLVRLPLLLKDAEVLALHENPTIHPAISAALRLASKMMINRDPVSLIGYSYVLEGSQNGGQLLRAMAIKSFGDSFDAISYFGKSSSETKEKWQRFVSCMDSLTLSDVERETVAVAALSFFEGMVDVFGGLFPFSEADLKYHASGSNPEAGDHVVPQNPREIEVATRAGIRAWERYPYLGKRFEERGQRFTRSDSCWLVALVGREQHSIHKNIFWLRSVLSSRGIPSVILETHMFEIANMFDQSLPGLKETIGFRQVADELKNRRLRIGGEEWQRSFSARWMPRLDYRIDAQFGPIVPLVLSAFADERDGEQGAFDSVLAWFRDDSRFNLECSATIGELAKELVAAQDNSK